MEAGFRGGNLDRASFGRRLLAVTIDWFIALATASLFIDFSANSLGAHSLRLSIFFSQICLLTCLGGASAGQRIMRIRVLTWPHQLFAKPLSILVRTFLLCLVFPTVITDSNSRGLHDRLAKTMVVKLAR